MEKCGDLFFTITKTIFSAEECFRKQLKTQTRVNSARQTLKQQTSTIIFSSACSLTSGPFDVFLDRKFNLKLNEHQIVA